MHSRRELHSLLCDILGSEHVYYQPPESLKIVYPAIVYSRNDIQNTFADNHVYKQAFLYTITVIDKDPDSQIVKDLSKVDGIRFDRHYTSDNLNHDTFIIYY